METAPWRDPIVWHTVVGELRDYLRRGLAALLTEDVVRFATARALVASGADPASLRVERPHPALKGSRVDLVIGGDSPSAAIEFKFPREPNLRDAPWPLDLGGVLKDFYRLAAYPGTVDRVFVYVEPDYLAAYLANTAVDYGVHLDVDDVVLDPAMSARLPKAAADFLQPNLATYRVTAHRVEKIAVDPTLSFSVYRVDPLAEAAPNSAAAKVPPPGPTTRNGARREILDAARAVLARSGADTFSPQEIVDEMARRGSGYAESTVRTMVTGHLCRNAPNNAATTYDDVERVGASRYRPLGPVDG